MTKAKTVKFNLRLTKEDKFFLGALAYQEGVTMSALIRGLIKYAALDYGLWNPGPLVLKGKSTYDWRKNPRNAGK